MLAITFCDRELLPTFVHCRVKQKFVAAECSDQHAKSVRSPQFSEHALPNEILPGRAEGISMDRLAARVENVRLDALW